MDSKIQIMKKDKWIKKIEENLHFKVSDKCFKFVDKEFNYLKSAFNGLKEEEYKEVEGTSFPNIKRNGILPEKKETRNLERKIILNNAKPNTSEDTFITYPKK